MKTQLNNENRYLIHDILSILEIQVTSGDFWMDIGSVLTRKLSEHPLMLTLVCLLETRLRPLATGWLLEDGITWRVV